MYKIHHVVHVYTLNNIGYLEGTLEYYYHATPAEPLYDSPGVPGEPGFSWGCMVIALKGSF